MRGKEGGGGSAQTRVDLTRVDGLAPKSGSIILLVGEQCGRVGSPLHTLSQRVGVGQPIPLPVYRAHKQDEPPAMCLRCWSMSSEAPVKSHPSSEWDSQSILIVMKLARPPTPSYSSPPSAQPLAMPAPLGSQHLRSTCLCAYKGLFLEA